jgi:hypothetical protein
LTLGQIYFDNFRCDVSEELDADRRVEVDGGGDHLLEELCHVEHVPEVEAGQTGVVLHHHLRHVTDGSLLRTQFVVIQTKDNDSVNQWLNIDESSRLLMKLHN